MVVTTTNSTNKLKNTELEIKSRSPVFKLRLFSLHLCLSLFGADSMIRLKLHIGKEGTLLQNMQRYSCNLVGMSCSRKIRCFHKRFCNTVPEAVIALGHSKPFNHFPGHINMKSTPSPQNHDHIFVVTKRVRPQPLYLFCYCGERLVHRQHRSLVWIQMFHSFLDQIHDMVE